MKFSIKSVANGNNGLFYKKSFLGLISKDNSALEQFSGHSDQSFDLDLCVEYLLQSNKMVFSNICSTGNQYFMRVSTKEFYIPDGVLKQHYHKQ